MIADKVKGATNVMMTVRIVPHEELPVFTYKARRWVDERQTGLAGKGGAS